MEKEKSKTLNLPVFKKCALIGTLGIALGFGGVLFTGCCADGKNGVNGAQWYSAETNIEDVNYGVDGDYYFDTDDYKLYQKENGQWILKVDNFGKPGTTPTISINNNGNWVINGVDTGIKAEGEDGNTPIITINADGYWVINNTPTSIKAKGDNGENGATWLTGSEPPASSVGSTNDLYLDALTGVIYKKNTSGWDRIGNIQSDAVNTFYIYTAEELWDALTNAEKYQGCTIKLKNDLDFTNVTHSPLLINARLWTNKTLCIDGGGYTIKNFTSIDSTIQTYTSGLHADGLIANIYGFAKFSIKNLTIDNMNISADTSESDVAGFIGNTGTSIVELTNCKIINSSLTAKRVGGLIGYTEVNSQVTIIDCIVENNVLTGKSAAAGLVSMDYSKATILSEYASNRCRVVGNTIKGIESDTDITAGISRVLIGSTGQIGTADKNVLFQNNSYIIIDQPLEGYDSVLGRVLVTGTLTVNGVSVTTDSVKTTD